MCTFNTDNYVQLPVLSVQLMLKVCSQHKFDKKRTCFCQLYVVPYSRKFSLISPPVLSGENFIRESFLLCWRLHSRYGNLYHIGTNFIQWKLLWYKDSWKFYPTEISAIRYIEMCLSRALGGGVVFTRIWEWILSTFMHTGCHLAHRWGVSYGRRESQRVYGE